METWLKAEDVLAVEGYKWFGQNRRRLHKKAVRGSGGVGVLIREEVLKLYQVEILDIDVEDVLWVKLSHAGGRGTGTSVGSLLHPSRGKQLAEQIVKFNQLGPIVMCGEVWQSRSRVRSLPTRRVIDLVKNRQGEIFVDFLRSVDMCVVNGRKGRGMRV